MARTIFTEVDRANFPFAIDWPYHVTTQSEDNRRFGWLDEVVGEENFRYNQGDYIGPPSLHFKNEADLFAYKLLFADLPYDPDRNYFDDTDEE